MDSAAPANHRMTKKKKQDKYLDITRELKEQ